MRKRIIILAILFTLLVFSTCERFAYKQDGPSPYSSFRDIPGITEDEIKAVEAFQEQKVSFIYGITTSVEAFRTENGNIEGFAVLFCEWLTKFFGIPFIPKIYDWDDLLEGLENGKIDFTGELTATDERRRTYIMTDDIASRAIKYFTLDSSEPLYRIAQSRPLRYVFFDDTTTIGIVQSTLTPSTYESLYVSNRAAAYDLLKSGLADAIITESTAEAYFELYHDVIVNDYFPLVFESVSMSTKKTEFTPIISVVQKMLRSGGIHHLSNLYTYGQRDYMKYKFNMTLTDEERNYIKNNPVISIAAERDLYPISFYDRRENDWQGIFFDLLDEISFLTGLSFEIAHDEHTKWPEIYNMLLNKEVSIVPELFQLEERKDFFIWPDTAMLTDYYALISKSDYPDITTSEIPYMKVGVTRSTAYTAMFDFWFPNHINTIAYEGMEEAFNALQRDEVDMVMATRNRLLHLTNYMEFPGYKINVLFNYPVENKFGFNRDEVILCSIVEKVLNIIDTEGISERWIRKTFDYRLKVMEAQFPLFIGLGVMMLSVIAFLFVLFRKTRHEERQLDKLVHQRTTELNDQVVKRSELLLNMQETMTKLEIALAETKIANEHTSIMFNAMPLGCHLWDKDANLLDCNRESLRMFGIPDKQEYIKRFHELSPEYQPDGRPSQEVVEYLNEMAMKEGIIVREYQHQKVNGEPVPTELVLTRIILNTGEYGIVTYLRDLTEYKAMIGEIEKGAADLKQALIRAEEASMSKSQFLANMSHEIRTPMNAILGITEIMLQNDTLEAEAKEALGKIYNSGDLLLNIINDILDLSKIEAGRLELSPVQYEIGSLLNDTAMLNIMRIGSKPIVFELSANENIPATLIGDELRIKQILNNVLTNAFKYTKEGTVKLSVSAEEGETESSITLVFIVSDTGQGMTKEQTSRLFKNEYIRFNKESNRTTEGTGLGMSITYNLVELMNGTISVESEPGKGSVFTVRLPQKKNGSGFLGREMTQRLEKMELGGKKQLNRARILFDPMPYGSVLVVDDMEANLYVAKGLMTPYGIKIDTAESGFEAVEKIKSGKVYDIVFMDHMMPVMDGIETVKKIRETGYDHPIVALTANAVVGQADVFLKNGFNGFISKPIDTRQLNDMLNKFIRDKQPPEVLEAVRAQNNGGKETADAPAWTDELLKELTLIDGLDVETGLKYAGHSRENYFSVLRYFTERCGDYMEKLEMTKEAKDWKNYTIHAHALKGVLASFGADKLSREAARLETASREGNSFDPAICLDETSAFNTELSQFRNNLKGTQLMVVQPEDNVKGDKPEGDVKFLKKQIKLLKRACAKYSFTDTKEILAAIRRYKWDAETEKELENIRHFVASFDYDKALEGIERLLRRDSH